MFGVDGFTGIAALFLASGATAPGLDSGFPVGVYHLPGQVDAVNLSINEDGTFFWNVCGCDYQTYSHGRWTPEGRGIALSPVPEKPLTWFAEFGFGNKVALPLQATRGPGEGEITVQGELTPAGTLKQVWHEGRICAVCGTGLGPSGQERCDAPLVMEKACSEQ